MFIRRKGEILLLTELSFLFCEHVISRCAGHFCMKQAGLGAARRGRSWTGAGEVSTKTSWTMDRRWPEAPIAHRSPGQAGPCVLGGVQLGQSQPRFQSQRPWSREVGLGICWNFRELRSRSSKLNTQGN